LEIAHQIRVQENRKRFLDSTEGVQAANREKVVLFGELEGLSDEISNSSKKLTFNKEQNDSEFMLSTYGFSLIITWSFEYSSTLKNSRLFIDLFKGLLSLRGGRRHHSEPELLKKMEFDFDRDAAGELGWRRLDKEKRFFSSAQLAEECMKILLEEVRNIRLNG
jgi:hypothetical protein